ncbi:helix-turn-helix transcriptional regulator [Kitasatospora sp. CM 4170]|uniref:Helix-turn-helix transcriptional regulator n=1 Tax=Kitasatospora aburaviensis TaxID=67265 RepID=A0ABW1F6R2_9ACTN|nr:helix-turn-helix transcriptional regulator [Kitasatospora sp. CM 4170]WNM49134.1 helix-turn-helix transcriptional regulator [Kitasatospora sp. CM 4170]
MLTTLGLTREAEAVYRLMLSQPDWGVVRIAGSLAWAEAAVRAAMDELADHELIRPSWEGGGAMRTVSPKVAFEALIARRQAEVARKQHEVESSRAAIAGLVAEYSMLRPEEGSGGVEHLTGLDEIRARLEELGAQACRETMSFAPGGKQTPENREASRPITQALLDRGVKVKTVYLSSIRNDPGSVEHANWLAAQGGETRTTSVLPMRMQIVDREVAMVPLDPDDLTKGVAVIRELGAVAGLCALFDQIWEQSEVLGAAPATPAGEITPQQRELLRLLSAGLTDEAAARRLGVSLRTERRMITDLMDQLGAQSRFQLGQRVTERGLL